MHGTTMKKKRNLIINY